MESLREHIRAQDAQLKAQDAQLKAQAEELAKLRALVEKLTEKLKQNSSNSSMPPSTDRGKNAERNAKKRERKQAGRKRGGQKGHKGHHRELLPPERVSAITDHYPARCAKCESTLPEEVDDAPMRHQVTEIPVVKPLVFEHRLHAIECKCGHRTRAQLPAHVPPNSFGAGAVATISLLTGHYRLSKRNASRILWDLFGVRICAATITDCERRMSEALEASHIELHSHVKQLRVVHADETSWRQGNERCWLWVAASKLVSFFMIQDRRSMDCAKNLLGEEHDPAATLITDRFSSYGFWDALRQVCWAHLERTYKGWSEKKKGTYIQIYGAKLLALIRKMWVWWSQFRAGELEPVEFQKKMDSHSKEFESVLQEAAGCGCARINLKALRLLEANQSLWTFVRTAGVEPTNNEAERDLRHAVILRLLSFGTDSARGSRFLERIFSAVASLRKQGRDIHTFLSQTYVAHLIGSAKPSLLPS